MHEVEEKFYNSRSAIFGTVLPVLSEFSEKKSLSENYLLKEQKECKQKIAKTKIICTIGPSSNTKKTLLRLIDAGMSVGRFNLSHDSFEVAKENIKTMREAAAEKVEFCSVIIDTRGCTLRTSESAEDSIELIKGERIKLFAGDEFCDSKKIFLNNASALKSIEVGDKIKISYGIIELLALEVGDDFIECEIMNSGSLVSRKSVFLPKGKNKVIGKLQKSDFEDIDFAVEVGADFIAASCIANAGEVHEIKEYLHSKKASHIKVFAKIECEASLKNFESILAKSDGIVLSRGNLGEDIDLEAVTVAQKLILKKCNSAGKIAVTSTQLLESMLYNPFPTRAEASDVGNAIFDGTDCLALSGETAIGSYPVESTEMLKAICMESERSLNHRGVFQMIYDKLLLNCRPFPIKEAVSMNAVKLAFDIKASLIIAFSDTGLTGCLVSKYRPKVPVILVTASEEVARQSKIIRGVTSIKVEKITEDASLIKMAVDKALGMGLVTKGNLGVLVRSNPGLINIITV